MNVRGRLQLRYYISTETGPFQEKEKGQTTFINDESCESRHDPMLCVSLTGIPLNTAPPDRCRKATLQEFVSKLSGQVLAMQAEVGNLHQFTECVDEHGGKVLAGITAPFMVTIRHFDTRLSEMENLVTALEEKCG